jgi:hypothetical protein
VGDMTDNDAMLASWDEKIMGESAAVAGAMVTKGRRSQCPEFCEEVRETSKKS